MHREQLAHARRGEVGIVQHARLVGEPEQFGEMQQRARAFLPADHDEMVLQAVEPGQEHDAGLVEARRRLKICRDSGTVGSRMPWKPCRSPAASRARPADAAGAMASKMPSSASE